MKKILLIGAVLLLAAVFATSTIKPETSTPGIVTTPIPTLILVPSSTPTPTPAPVLVPGLSNDNHYENSAGNEVHSPAYSTDGCVAAGASARCGDGTCSFSQSRRGTCSHHGGVAQWL